MRDPWTTMPTPRRRRVRARPRWSTGAAVSLIAATCALCGGAPAAGLDEWPIQGDAVGGRRLATDPLESVDATAILREIGQVNCPDAVSKTIRTFLDVNKVVVEACTNQTGYELYPYGTKLPDADQTALICSSPNCMDLVTGVVLAKLPECEYQRYSPRSFAESFLRVRVDLLNGRRAPTAAEFGQLYALNRVINYLTENTTIQASVKTDFKASEAAASLTPLKLSPDIVLSDGLVVMVNESAAADSSGSVHAAPNPTTTQAPTSVFPSTGSSSSSESTNSTGSAKDDDLPENLQTAYLYTGLLWFLINVLYYWIMIRKGSDD